MKGFAFEIGSLERRDQEDIFSGKCRGECVRRDSSEGLDGVAELLEQGFEVERFCVGKLIARRFIDDIDVGAVVEEGDRPGGTCFLDVSEDREADELGSVGTTARVDEAEGPVSPELHPAKHVEVSDRVDQAHHRAFARSLQHAVRREGRLDLGVIGIALAAVELHFDAVVGQEDLQIVRVCGGGVDLDVDAGLFGVGLDDPAAMGVQGHGGSGGLAVDHQRRWPRDDELLGRTRNRGEREGQGRGQGPATPMMFGCLHQGINPRASRTRGMRSSPQKSSPSITKLGTPNTPCSSASRWMRSCFSRPGPAR